MQSSSQQPALSPHGDVERPLIPEAFRGFMSSYFTGVAIITSVDGDGRPHGLTCNSLTSVTLSPPTLLICLDERSGTLSAVRSCAGFVVNLLHAGGRRAAEVFASTKPDRFDQVTWERSARTGLPWLVEDTHAMAECVLADIKVVGDHAVVFGTVVNVEIGAGSPLLYGSRTFTGAPELDARSGGGISSRRREASVAP
ncbi:flavin reductase family protein [Actinokineospora sp.]|uniref:flavin reductase family protein n=1 Tax=Actinokineospora sp. TaxID=1872133 RepID=UPI0040384CAA